MSLTPGTDTYATLAEADTYFGGRLGSDSWDAAVDATQEKALKMAFRALERFHYVGEPATSSQTARWPREDVYDQHGEELSTTAIPAFVKDAQCEQALFFLQVQDQGGADALRASLQRQGVSQVKMGDVFENYVGGRTAPGALCPEAMAIIGRYLLRTPRQVKHIINRRPDTEDTVVSEVII